MTKPGTLSGTYQIKTINYFFKISNQFEVRYLITLRYKEKALARMRRGFLFSDRTGRARVRAGNKKSRHTPKADAGLLTWAVIQRGMLEAKRIF